MLPCKISIDVPYCQSIQEQTKTYPVRSFQSAERHSFKILYRLDCFPTKLVRHLDTPREVSSAGIRSLSLSLVPFCVLSLPYFRVRSRCNEAVYSFRFDGRC